MKIHDLWQQEGPQGIFLIGSPGSGKSTLTRYFSDKGYALLYGGDLLREEVKKGTADGLEIRRCAENGLIISDDLILRVLKPYAVKAMASSFVFDSFPITLKQFDFLYDLLTQYKRLDDLKIIHVDVTPEEALWRLSGRLTCQDCAHVYNKQTRPPKREGICDECGGALFARPQDQGHIAKERMVRFADATLPIFEKAKALNIPVLKYVSP